MKSLKWLFLVLMGSTMLTSCFDILEEVTYHKDGSGEFRYVFDMSGLKPMMDMVAAMDTTGEMSMDTLSSLSREFASKVDGLAGISSIEEINDEDAFTYGISFKFANLDALNAAVNQLTEGPGIGSGEEDLFGGSKKKFSRLDAGKISGLFDEIMGEAGGENAEMAMMFFKDVSYTTVYHFDKKVKSMSNDKAELSDDKKTVTMKYYIFDEERGGKNASVANTIKLKGGLF
ncbi:MAG: hypothetical protein KDC24_03695 [Saprospiraceae bacterium]|nr:hypothetical protein [Saprospiraceae bacterium]